MNSNSTLEVSLPTHKNFRPPPKKKILKRFSPNVCANSPVSLKKIEEKFWFS